MQSLRGCSRITIGSRWPTFSRLPRSQRPQWQLRGGVAGVYRRSANPAPARPTIQRLRLEDAAATWVAAPTGSIERVQEDGTCVNGVPVPTTLTADQRQGLERSHTAIHSRAGATAPGELLSCVKPDERGAADAPAVSTRARIEPKT